MNTSEVRAPINPEERYDDPTYESLAPKVLIIGMSPMYVSDNLGPPLGDPNSPAENASWGYLFHDACWSLLTEACHPFEIDVQVLNDFCRSFPNQPSELIDWGHDYGGIFETSSEIPPGGTHWLGRLKEVRRRPENNYSADEVYHADPLCIPLLDLLLKETEAKREFVGRPPGYPHPSAIKSEGILQNDCFETLPLELREMILLYLSTRDVRSLIFASRAVASSPISQAFWASRFQKNFEFSFFFELRKSSGATSRLRDWRSLFHRVRECIDISNFHNRKRIWDILQPFADAIISFSSTKLCGNPRPTFFHPDISDDKLEWRRAAGSILEQTARFYSGCKILFTRSVNVPSRVVGILVSMIQLGGAEFVTGLRFIDSHGATANLGYILPGKELYVDVQDEDTNKPGNSGLRGFNLAVEENGIHALAAVTAPGKKPAWAGSPKNSPRMRLLSYSSDIGRIKGDFDVSLCFLLLKLRMGGR